MEGSVTYPSQYIDNHRDPGPGNHLNNVVFPPRDVVAVHSSG